MSKKPRVTSSWSGSRKATGKSRRSIRKKKSAIIKGFKTKAEVDEWLNGTRKIDWLRSQGYAK